MGPRARACCAVESCDGRDSAPALTFAQRFELKKDNAVSFNLGSCRCLYGLPPSENRLATNFGGLKLRAPTVAALCSFFVREESEKAARPVSASTKESQPRRVLLLTSRGMVQLPASGGL